MAVTEARDVPKEKGKTTKGTGKVQANWADPCGDIQENRKVGHTNNSAGRAARSDTSQQNAEGKSPMSMRTKQTAEKAEDNRNQNKMEKSEECGSSGMWRRSSRRRRQPAACGADPSTGQVRIGVMNYI